MLNLERLSRARRAQIVRVLQTPRTLAPAWLTPELAVELTPLDGDVVSNSVTRDARVVLLVAVARRGVHDLRRHLAEEASKES
jgi:hypothetical protein